MRLPRLVTLISPLLSLFVLACGEDTEVAQSATVDVSTSAPVTPALPSPTTLAAADTLHAWVDGLSLRAEPRSDATRVGRAGPEDVLSPTGQIGGEETAVVLRGGLYETPWLEVATAEGTTGWVFAGGVRRPSDPPGPKQASANAISIEHFGNYDFSRWREVARGSLAGGDIDGEVIRYRAAARTLEVETTEAGEMRYDVCHRLLGENGELFREHRLSFSADGGDNILAEEVINYEGDAPRRYVREQRPSTHYSLLAQRPSRVVGDWQVVALEKPPAATMTTAPVITALAEGATLPEGRWRSLDDPRAGLIIVGQRLGHSYDGRADKMEVYRIADSCPSAYEGPEMASEPGRFLVVEDSDGPMCYLLSELGADSIIMNYIGAGNELRYERLPEEGL